MKLRFWLFLCGFVLFLGCSNDASLRQEQLGTQRAALGESITVTIDPTRVVRNDDFRVSWSANNPNLLRGATLSFRDSLGSPVHAEIALSTASASGSFDLNTREIYSAFGVTARVCGYLSVSNETLASNCADIEVVEPPYTLTNLSVWSDSESTRYFSYGEPLHVEFYVSDMTARPQGEGSEPSRNFTGKMHLVYVFGESDDGTFLEECEVGADGYGSCEISNPGPWVPVGEYLSIVGTYFPSNRFAWSKSTGWSSSFTVAPASTTVKIASSNSPSPLHETATFEVEVAPESPSTAPPTGSVTLYLDKLAISDPTPVVTNTTTGVSTATVHVTNSVFVGSAGSKTVRATFAADAPNDVANFLSSASEDTFSHEVGLTATTRSYSSNPSTWTYGANVSLKVTVASAGSTPTGTVRFYEGNSAEPTAQIGSPVNLVSESGQQVATLATTMTALGSRTILAVYSGDASHDGGSLPITQTVAQASPQIQLVLDTTDTVFSSNVIYGAQLSHPTGASTSIPLPTGTVQFSYSTDGGEVFRLLGDSHDLGSLAAASMTHAGAPVGDLIVRVRYSPDASSPFYRQVQADRTLKIRATPTTLELRSSKNPSTITTTVRFSATVRKTGTATLNPQGKILFKAGTTELGNITVDADGVASVETATLALGDHSITASFEGGSNWGTSSSDPLTQNIDAAEVTTNLTSSRNPALVGTPIVFRATFGSVVTGPATGTVQFFDGERSLGSAPLEAGLAMTTVSDLASGAHLIRAQYAGDGTHAGGTASLVQVMTRVATTTTIATTAPASTEYGAPVPLTATVTSTAGIPSGTIAFRDGATVLGFVTLDATGKASFTANLLTVGTHSFSAQYFGATALDPSASAAISHSVTKIATALSVVSSANPSPVAFSVKFTATIAGLTPGVTPTGTITFRNGTTTLGSGTLGLGGVATFSTSALPAGTHAITASYAGDAHFAATTSAALTQTVAVNAAAITLASSPNPSTTGQAVTLSVDVAGSLGLPTGALTFKNGTTTLGTSPIVGGRASLTTSDLPVGTLNLVAEYGGDAQYGAGSATVSHVIRKVATTVGLVASQTTAAPGAPITFTVNVSAAAGTATGEVELFDATTSIGTQSLVSSGTAFSISNLTPGQHVVTAVYKGTATLAEGRSNSIIVDITSTPNADAGTDEDAGTSSGSSGTSSGSTSGAATADGGAGVNTSGGLDIDVGGSNGGGDDCAMMPGETGSLTAPVLLGLVVVLARRRRKIAA